jgi:hypothetical protein
MSAQLLRSKVSLLKIQGFFRGAVNCATKTISEQYSHIEKDPTFQVRSGSGDLFAKQ